MHADNDGAALRPTPLMDRWREACLHALATADPHGAHDRYLASFIGEYFLAIHSGLEMIGDPRVQEQFCAEEAARFLAMLGAVPDCRQQFLEAKADTLRRDGLLMFPEPTDECDTT